MPSLDRRYRSRSRSYSPDHRPRRHHRSSSQRRRDDSRDETEEKKRSIDKQEEQQQEEEVDPNEDEETKMMRLMGFGNFDTTKEKHVPGTDISGAKVRKPLKYRQYMNRRGGFNR